jgi:hypothetical protein
VKLPIKEAQGDQWRTQTFSILARRAERFTRLFAIMCGHLPILIARCANKRFQWLMAMIGLPTGESLLGVEKVTLSKRHHFPPP